MFRRIWYYISHNLGNFCLKTVILAVFVFFFVSAMLMGNLASELNQSFSEVMDNSMTVITKYSSRYNNLLTLEETIKFENEMESLFQELKDTEGLIYSDYWITSSSPLSWSAFNENNEFVVNGNWNFFDQDMYRIEKGYVYTNELPAREGIYATNNTIPKGLYADGVHLSEGRYFTDDEINEGKLVCIVPYCESEGFDEYITYYNYDGEQEPKNMRVGDILKVSVYQSDGMNVIDQKTWDIEIIGEYNINNPKAVRPDLIHSQDGNMETPIILPYQTLMTIQNEIIEFKEQYDSEFTRKVSAKSNNRIDGFYFQTENIDALQKMRRMIEDTDLYRNGFINYSTGLEGFEILLANIYTTTDSFKTIAAIIMVLSILYCALLSSLNVIYRKGELAILQSMGEKRKTVLSQVMIEQLISLILAFGLSLPTSLFAVREIASTIFMGEGTSAVNSTMTTDVMKSIVHYSTMNYLIAFVLMVPIMLVSFLITSRMMKKFHVRTLLNGDDGQ